MPAESRPGSGGAYPKLADEGRAAQDAAAQPAGARRRRTTRQETHIPRRRILWIVIILTPNSSRHEIIQPNTVKRDYTDFPVEDVLY